MDQGKEVQESYQAIYERALEVFRLANPVRENRALACVYLPEDLVDGMKTEVCPRFSIAEKILSLVYCDVPTGCVLARSVEPAASCSLWTVWPPEPLFHSRKVKMGQTVLPANRLGP